jgi:hypothetical protein
MGAPFGNIEVRGARENNLKNISLDIPPYFPATQNLVPLALRQEMLYFVM